MRSARNRAFGSAQGASLSMFQWPGRYSASPKIPINDPSVGISRHDAAKLKTLLGVVPHSRSWKQQSELEYQCPNLGGKVHDPNTGS
jgi:hypothetical protein